MGMKMASSSSIECRKRKATTVEAVGGGSRKRRQRQREDLGGRFLWWKKIERDLLQGRPAMKKRHSERMAEIEKIKKRRTIEKAQREEGKVGNVLRRLDQQPADHIQLQAAVKSEGLLSKTVKSEPPFNSPDTMIIEPKQGPEEELDKYKPRKPKYFNRFHTGYVWNKYNRTHYDHDNPPPEAVQGYKFDIFYPDLIDRAMVPTYTIEKDGSNGETCLIRFHAGPPYEDIAFQIENKEWDYSRKNGFRCTFECGILHLYFNHKRRGRKKSSLSLSVLKWKIVRVSC